MSFCVRSSNHYQEEPSSLLAIEAEKYLGKAIATVEKEQYRDFDKPVKVYAVSTLDNFENYCAWRSVLGCVINKKVFLSPRILSEPSGTFPRLLTHELSHLHLDQQLSVLEWASIPVWFREGLAIYVSTKSGGAELDFSEAKIEIKNGNSFYPNKKGSLFFSKSHVSFGLSRALFYRQAGSFIKFLRLSNKKGFKNLLLSIQEKKNFAESFKKHFGVSI